MDCKHTDCKTEKPHCRYCGFKTAGIDDNHVVYHALVKHMAECVSLIGESHPEVDLEAEKEKLRIQLGM